MFQLFRLKLRKELEELKSLHRIEMKEKEAELERQKKDAVHSSELKLREVTSLLKLDSEQTLKKMELGYEQKLQEEKRKQDQEKLNFQQEVLQTNYEKLTAAMSKLHEEGNVTTKFTQELALSMMANAPAHKTQVRVLSKPEEK